MATHSSILARRIPGMEEPGGLLSMGSHRVRHDWSDLEAAAATDVIRLRIFVSHYLLDNDSLTLFYNWSILSKNYM